MQPESGLLMSHSPLILKTSLMSKAFANNVFVNQPLVHLDNVMLPVSICTKHHNFIDGNTGDSSLPPVSQSWNSQNCLTQDTFSFSWLSRWNSHEEVWWMRAGVWLSNAEGISSARVFPSSSSGHSGGLPPSWFVLLGTRNAGGEGRTISCRKQLCSLLAHHPLVSCSFGTIAVMFWVLAGHPLPQFSLSCRLFQNYLGCSTFQAYGPVSPCRVEQWFSVWSCGLLLWCCYLVWTSSSRSQLGSGWPIL